MELRTDIVLVDERLSIRRTILACRAVFAARTRPADCPPAETQ